MDHLTREQRDQRFRESEAKVQEIEDIKKASPDAIYAWAKKQEQERNAKLKIKAKRRLDRRAKRKREREAAGEYSFDSGPKQACSFVANVGAAAAAAAAARDPKAQKPTPLPSSSRSGTPQRDDNQPTD